MGSTATTGVRLVEANTFELRGGSVLVTFSTSSFTGDPRLTYQDRRTRMSFAGDQIRMQPSEIGTLVTVTLEAIPDLRTMTFSLIVPAVRLENPAMGTIVRLPGVQATSFTTIAGPGPGQETVYQTLDLSGRARFLDF